jgi:L-histidine N-alpha-methyltransferase
VSGAATADVRIDRAVERDTLAAEVRDGLGRDPMELPPKLFYDARGSELFDQITAQPEYYPTRCERSILNRHAPRLVEGAEELVEIGSGTASKTRALLYAMAGSGNLRRYVPFDVDVSVVEACADELVELYPGLSVHGVVGDFGADEFLARLRGMMGPEDRLILGTDFVKEREVLEAAYNDAAGVTAEFNRNMLRVMNAELGANFEPEAFEHVARFNEADSHIEMRLRASSDQRVDVTALDLGLRLPAGAELLTEISTKFTPAAVAGDLRAAGLALDELLTDDEGMFGLAVATCG